MMMQNNTADDSQLSLHDLAVRIESVPGLPSARRGSAAAMRITYKDFGSLSFTDYEVFSSLPEHPFWSQVDRLVDFSFADELCASLYSPYGQRPYAPSLKLKVHFLKACENLSDRETEMRMIYDVAIKRFLGVPMTFTGLDHSTIGLDRDRLGSAIFHACFHYVLAQARRHQLWGGHGERWLIDAFHTYAPVAPMGAGRLIKRGMLQLVQHLKRSHPALFQLAVQMLGCDQWFALPPKDATEAERDLLFSQLTMRAYGLLSWFEHAAVKPRFWSWTNAKQQLHSLEMQAALYDILQQNTRLKKPPSDNPAQTGEPVYEKVPHKERPTGRIVNAHDPEIRIGRKTKTKSFAGDKVQVLGEGNSDIILEAEPVAGNEADGDAMVPMVSSVLKHHDVKPEEVVGDTVYGTVSNRKKLQEMGIAVRAPVQKTNNPTGLYASEMFHYDPEREQVTCPQGHTATKKGYNQSLEGYQYFFGKRCADCPVKQECTTNEKGRTFFVSDHREALEAAAAHNQTPEGQQSLKVRNRIERTNNELANHHGLRHPKTRGRRNMRIQVKMTAMVVNVKIMVKRLGTAVTETFRYKRKQGIAPVCP